MTVRNLSWPQAALAALALLAAILTAAGCGGSSSSSSSLLSQKEVIKQGDAICRKIGSEVRKELVQTTAKIRQAGQTGIPAQEKLIVEVAAPSVAKVADEISKLAAKAEESDEVEKIAAGFQAAATEVEEDPRHALKTNVFGDAADQAGAYGFQYCSQI
jgi:DNA-directed RNA polymerase beta' subunit